MVYLKGTKMTVEELIKFNKNDYLYYVSTTGDIYKLQFNKIYNDRIYFLIQDDIMSMACWLCKFLFNTKKDAIIYLYEQSNKDHNILLKYKNYLEEYIYENIQNII